MGSLVPDENRRAFGETGAFPAAAWNPCPTVTTGVSEVSLLPGAKLAQAHMWDLG